MVRLSKKGEFKLEELLNKIGVEPHNKKLYNIQNLRSFCSPSFIVLCKIRVFRRCNRRFSCF